MRAHPDVEVVAVIDPGPVGDAATMRSTRVAPSTRGEADGVVPAARLRPERPFLELVPRSRLVERLAREQPPLVLVSAPAGWGKSTVLAQWVEADIRPTAWLRLEAVDDDLATMLADLGSALEHVAPVDRGALDLLRSRRPPISGRVLPAFADALATADPFLLILDDAHQVLSPECWAVVRSILDDAPEGSTLGIAARSDPPLDLARLRAAGALVEVHTEELALDRDELLSLLRLRRLALDSDEVDALMRLTEGWPAGITLALLSLQGELSRNGPSAAWGREAIASYLTTEVLEHHDARMRNFLLRTSILERLSAPLCLAVTCDPSARSLLQASVHGNVFLSSLDDDGTWYRCHPLFRAILRTELGRCQPDEIDALHHRAAAWLAGHGHPEEAVRHWLEADATDAAVDLVVATCDRYLCDDEVWRARRLLERIPEHDILARPSLTLTAGWVYMASGDEMQVKHWGRAAGHADIEEGPSPDGAASRRSSQLLLRAALALDGITQMRRDAEEGARLEEDRPGSWRTFAMLRLGAARYLDGEGGAATAPLLEALAAGELPERAEALGYLALVAADDERWDEADRAVREIVRLVPTIATGGLPDSCDLAAPIAVAQLHAHVGDADAVDLVDAIGRLCDSRPRLPRSTLFAAVLLGELCRSLGETERMRHWAARTCAALREYPDAGILRPRAERLVDLSDALQGVEEVTPAEARVLALLPTHLSHRQIGERLFVTTNTVRTHLRHLYAKLDVTTRADAVLRAEQLGLLPGRSERTGAHLSSR